MYIKRQKQNKQTKKQNKNKNKKQTAVTKNRAFIYSVHIIS